MNSFMQAGALDIGGVSSLLIGAGVISDKALPFSAADLSALAPLLVVAMGAFVVLLWDVLLKPTNKGILMGISLVTVGVALGLTIQGWGALGTDSRAIAGGHLVLDRFGLFFNGIVLTVSLLVLLISKEFLDREEIHIGEYYSLLLFALSGMMLLTQSADLVMTFVAIEVMSIPVYVLAAYNRGSYRCIESALKYFILGAFASGFLLYGIALLYGHAGTTELAKLHDSVARGGFTPLLSFGIGLVLVGFAFKVGAAPFHMWAPDVYEGASTPVTAAMATGVKVAAFAALIRTVVALAPAGHLMQPIIMVLAGLTVVIGNIGAIRQENLKRMLAYSGIAHTGYMMMGLLAIGPGTTLTETAVSALAFYAAAYVIMNLGTFAILIMMGRKEAEPLRFADWNGIGFRFPVLGAALTLLMCSMGGLPPTAGFFAKFYLFSAVLEAGYSSLVILAVLTSAASFFYYLRVVVHMYMHDGQQEVPSGFSLEGRVALAIAIILTALLGVLPSGPLSVLDWARDSLLASL